MRPSFARRTRRRAASKRAEKRDRRSVGEADRLVFVVGQEAQKGFGEAGHVPPGDAGLIGEGVPAPVVDGAEFLVRVVRVEKRATAVVEGLARNGGVVGVHDAVDEAHAEPARVSDATRQLEGNTVADKNEVLFRHGINFNDVPNWQKRGTGFRWESYEKPGVNPKTGEQTSVVRRRVTIDRELPLGDAYCRFIIELLESDASR